MILIIQLIKKIDIYTTFFLPLRKKSIRTLQDEQALTG